MPQVSRRNISFYRGLTLVRKIYTIARTRIDRYPQLIRQLAASARAALQEVGRGSRRAPIRQEVWARQEPRPTEVGGECP